jgi:hypothetical protein
MNTDNEIDHYHLGWAFFNTYGVKGGCFLPLETDNLVEWMQGFMAAQADYDLPQEYKSVEAALIDNGAEGVLLTKLLQAADSVASGDELCIVPNVPVRGRAKLSLV